MQVAPIVDCNAPLEDSPALRENFPRTALRKDGEKGYFLAGSIAVKRRVVGEIINEIKLLPVLRGEGAGRRMRGGADLRR